MFLDDTLFWNVLLLCPRPDSWREFNILRCSACGLSQFMTLFKTALSMCEKCNYWRMWMNLSCLIVLPFQSSSYIIPNLNKNWQKQTCLWVFVNHSKNCTLHWDTLKCQLLSDCVGWVMHYCFLSAMKTVQTTHTANRHVASICLQMNYCTVRVTTFFS
jgi:hypothetical protein